MKKTANPLILFVIGTAATMVLAMYSAFTQASETVRASVFGIGLGAICAICGAVVLGVSLSFGRREQWRRQWLLVGLGVSGYAMGRLINAIDIAFGDALVWLPPADAFILSQYVLLGAAFVAVAQSYLALTDPRRPALIVAIFGAIALGALWFGLIVPFVIPRAQGIADALRMALYPAADILLLMVPAGYVALLLAQLGGVRFARPWYLVAAGAGLLALSDAATLWLQATAQYAPGSLVDFGAIAAQLLMASGALAAARLAEEFMSPVRGAVAEVPA